ncbi:MAG: 6,7-dimethyl-8-ribityllumazine synthase [Bacteroidota bacterium]|nr:6,7-dimethyl-8-ribityllumazine synthase [Bacteroidota bacterium]
MPRIFEGEISAKGRRFAVVASRFNRAITQRLLDGALECFKKHGCDVANDVDVFYCPGAFELPQVAARVTLSIRYAAVICLGAVIRGETPHFDYIAAESARGIGIVARERNIPVLFGVLTTNTYDQALERSGGSVGNKGWDAALAAITMADLYAQIQRIEEREKNT